MKKGLLAAMGLFFCLSCFADIRLPSVIASNMVLQQQSTAKLWGWCEPGERVIVTTSWNGRSDTVGGNRDGKWQIGVPTPSAGGPFTIDFKGRNNSIHLDNVMIGEVWVCSGQSNMEMCETWGLPDVQAELPVCATNDIHFFHIPRTTSQYPQDDCPGVWKACDSSELKHFSAAGYFFAKKLNQELHVPIGMIEAAWGGTPAEVWTPSVLVTGDSVLEKAATALRPSGGWPYIPGYCFNGMIAPICNYAIAGAIWYQGESNTGTAATYARLFTTMINAWRKAFDKDLPFYYVQIAPYTYGKNEDGAWLREQQAASMSLENTGMVVISDLVNDTANIHPKDKHDVGYRLADWALAKTYHKAGVAYESPMYKDMEVKGGKIIINTEAPTPGLVSKGAGAAAHEFVIAGEDKVFYPAEVKIDGSQLVVWSKEVKQPVAVRYEFDNAGMGNIFSKDGLPLAPFRTDNW